MASKAKVFANQIIKDYLEELAGPNALKTAKSLPVTEPRSEYEIAEEIKVNINKLRSILYKFYSKNLVTYTRQRDAKKGWYIYHWKFYTEKLVSQIISDRRDELKKLEKSAPTASEEQVYMCPNCNEGYDFSRAFNHDFMCPNCKISLNTVDTKKLANKSKKEQKAIETEIKQLEKLL